MAALPTNSRQVPDLAILDTYNKQAYLSNAFVYAVASATLSGTSEVNYLLISNPATNGHATTTNAQSVSMFLNYLKLISVTAAKSDLLRFYYNPTITGAGTPVTTIANRRMASAITSKMVIATGATTSANGTLIASLTSTGFTMDVSHELFILDPGKSILVTVTPDTDGNKISTEFGWYEI